MTISGQIEVKNYFDKPILRLILSIVFFRRYLSRFLWKACKISRIFNPYWNFWTFLRHFRSISDPKSALFCRKSDLNVHRMTSEVVLWITKPSESRHFSLLFKTNSHFHKSSQKSEFYSNGDPFLNPLRHFNCSIHAFISFRSDQESENTCAYLSEFPRWRHFWPMTSWWTNRMGYP